MSSSTIPVPQTPVTNPPFAVLRCGPPERESCAVLSPFSVWRSTPEDKTLCQPAVTQDTQGKGARDLEGSAPDVISLRIDDFKILWDQARRGETVICWSERVDTSLEAILSKITWNGQHIDKSTGASEIFDVISRILEALTVESEKKLPAPDLVKAVAGSIGDVAENIDTYQGRNPVAKTQIAPSQKTIAAPLESEAGIITQA
ncbi:hypothetical protein DFP72DRAFT_1048511 [Ephemerocybe angulata]|uniref:Uncharacterized protein n=1 Tax=Ephemerocybe angulata TaxID=980116 RepID=A0A8H6M3J8_9AGAR|nr:hypothetical protein DFP72DRAFT_1048511 [Tulosesus angulatus]